MRTLTTIFILVLTGIIYSQPFGRFGYSVYPSVPGFAVSEQGFKTKHAASDWFRYSQTVSLVKPIEISSEFASYFLRSGGSGPDRLRVNLLAPGFELHFSYGFQFRLSSTQAPYLSWSEASVEAGVPTAASRWCLVSFRDQQPPILIVFIGKSCSVRLAGAPGDWRLESTGLFAGWVRIATPFGLTERATSGVAELGRQIKAILQHEELLTQEGARVSELQVTATDKGVRAVWKTTKKQFVIPPLFAHARRVGSHVAIASGQRTLDASTDEGPITISTESKLVVDFPSKRIPNGRALVLNPNTNARISPPSKDAAVLALQNLLSDSSLSIRAATKARVQEFITSTPYDLVPATSHRLPFGPKGERMNLVGAFALLMQSHQSAAGQGSLPNSLFTSAVWRRDWFSGMLWDCETDVARQACAALAIAGTLCPDPVRRLEGALFETGLLAEEGLARWRRLKGFASSTPRFIEPFAEIRRYLYPSAFSGPSSYGDAVCSFVRVIGEPRLEASLRNGILLRWVATEPGQLKLSAAYPVSLQPKLNLASFGFTESLGELICQFSPTSPGACEALLSLPSWTPSLPAYDSANAAYLK